MLDEYRVSVYDDFEPTADEKKLAKQILVLTESIAAQNDDAADAILLGERAVPLFETSGLPLFLLGEIWNVCDEHRGGFLTFNGVCLALRLMGNAQALGDDAALTEVKMGWFRPGKPPYLDALADAPRPQPQPQPQRRLEPQRPTISPPAQSMPSLLEASPTEPGKRSSFWARLAKPLAPSPAPQGSLLPASSQVRSSLRSFNHLTF